MTNCAACQVVESVGSSLPAAAAARSAARANWLRAVQVDCQHVAAQIARGEAEGEQINNLRIDRSRSKGRRSRHHANNDARRATAECRQRQIRDCRRNRRRMQRGSTTCNLLKGQRDHFRMIKNAIRCLRHAEALESPRVTQSQPQSQPTPKPKPESESERPSQSPLRLLVRVLSLSLLPKRAFAS